MQSGLKWLSPLSDNKERQRTATVLHVSFMYLLSACSLENVQILMIPFLMAIGAKYEASSSSRILNISGGTNEDGIFAV